MGVDVSGALRRVREVKNPGEALSAIGHDEAVKALRDGLWTPFGAAFLILAALALGSASAAQIFSASAYYQQCLRFEAGGDLETARQNCLNALELDSGMVAARLALARIELGLGRVAAAESLLAQVRGRSDGPEFGVLMAEVALLGGRYAEAERQLSSARSRTQAGADPQLDSRINFVAGRVAQAQADFPAAVAQFRSAIRADGLTYRYRHALASLLFRLGEAGAARDELLAYQQLTDEHRNPELLALAGRINWGLGDAERAARDLEAAVALRGSGEGNLQARDLQALAFIYYGQGDLRSGWLALREAMQRGTLLSDSFNRILPWLLGVMLVLALHLMAESRVPSATLGAPLETPSLWTLAEVYGALLLALLVGLVGMVVYSALVYGNALAFVTPLQRDDTRAVYYAVTAVALSAAAVWRVGRRGWDAGEELLGKVTDLSLGLLGGAGLLLLVLGYLYYAPRLLGAGWGGYYLDLFHLRPTVVAAALLVPLAQLYFSAFALPPLLKRYPRPYAVAIAALVFALALASPLPLLFGMGWALSRIFVRSKSGAVTMVAKLVVNVGLVLGVAFLPPLRALFL